MFHYDNSARRSAAILSSHSVLTMEPSRRADQTRRQHRKQLRHKEVLPSQPLHILIQGNAPDVIEDATNQLVGTGLIYVGIPDEQKDLVQPPTTSQPWCAGSKSGISQSRSFDTSTLSLSSIFCKYSKTLYLSSSPCTYILFRFSESS